MTPRRPTRLDWLVSVLLVVAGVGAFAALQFGGPRHEFPWWRIVYSLTIPILFGFCFRDIAKVVHEERLWRMVRHLPSSIQFERQEDGSVVAFVQRIDGEPVLVKLPDGYDPREDDGRYLFELLERPPQ